MNAKWEREIANRSADSGALNEILYPSEFVHDGIFVTKRGHVCGVLRIQPAPFEIMDPADVRLMTERIEAALRGLDPSIRVYQYIVKSAAPSGLHQIRIYWALVYEQNHSHDWWSWFYFPKSGAAKIDAEIQSSASILSMYMDTLAGALPGMERLNCEDTFQFLRRLVNYSPNYGLKLAESWGLYDQMSCAKIDARRDLTVDRHHLRVLTIEVTPKLSPPNLWAKVLDIPCEFVVCQEWQSVSHAETQRLIKSMKSHFVNQLRGLRAALGDLTTKAETRRQLHPDEMVTDGGKAALLADLKAAEEAIAKEGLTFGEYSLTFVLHSEDLNRLRSGVSAVMNVIHPHGAQASEGLGQAALAAWLAIIPGHERVNVRRLKIDNKSLARMSFAFGPPEGNAYNAFLKAPCLTEWVTERGTPYHFNLHLGQVGHTPITGASGMGKTYLLKWLITDSQQYRPQSIIFDVTSSFRDITAEHGGSYLELGGGARRGQNTINPFALPPTADNFAFNTSFVRMLIESDGGPALTAGESQDLYEQVVTLMTTDLPPGHRRLRNLHPEPDPARRLARWCNEGQHAWLFDNSEDTLSFATFQAFSFLGMQQDKEVLSALLFYVLHRSLQIIYETDRPSFVWMDEAINFLEHPVMCDYIFRALLNWRKQEASLILVLHSLTDIPRATAVRLLQGCRTRLHLANPGIDTDAWRELLHCSQAQVDIIRRLIPAQQLLVEGAGVMNLVATPERHARLATQLEKATA